MILPLWPDQPLRRTPWVTPTLLVLNVLIHIGMLLIEAYSTTEHARILNQLAVIRGAGFHWHQLFTSAFLHAGVLHLAGNMVFLYCFGRSVEDRMGSWRFLAFYLLAAAASGGAHMALESAGAIGASGAIAGVTGAFLVLFPKTTIRCFYIFGGIIGVPAWWIIGFQIAMNLVFFQANDGIARAAHLGGYGFGFGVAMGLLWLKIVPRQPYDLFSSMKQAKRRRQFKAAAEQHTKSPVSSPESKKADARTEALAEARSTVSGAISTGDMPAAVEAYRKLCSEFGSDQGATTLSRNAQYRLASHLLTEGLHAESAEVWTRFLEAYHKDPEADGIRVLLARILADDLGQPEQARAQLERVLEKSTDDEIKGMARDDFEALNARFPSITENES